MNQSKENIPSNRQVKAKSSKSHSTMRRSSNSVKEINTQKQMYNQIINQSLAELMNKPPQIKEISNSSTRLRSKKSIIVKPPEKVVTDFNEQNIIKKSLENCLRNSIPAIPSMSIQHSNSVLKLSKEIMNGVCTEDNSIKIPLQMRCSNIQEKNETKENKASFIKPLLNSNTIRNYPGKSEVINKQCTSKGSERISNPSVHNEDIKFNCSVHENTNSNTNSQKQCQPNSKPIPHSHTISNTNRPRLSQFNKEFSRRTNANTNSVRDVPSSKKQYTPNENNDIDLPSVSPIFAENMGITFNPPESRLLSVNKPIVPPKVFPETNKGNYLGDSLSLNEQNIEEIIGSNDNFEDKLKSIIQITPIKDIGNEKSNMYSLCAYDVDALQKNEDKIENYVTNISKIESKYKEIVDKLQEEEKSVIMQKTLQVLQEEVEKFNIASRLFKEIEAIREDYKETRKLLKRQKLLENEQVYGDYNKFHKQLKSHTQCI